MPHAISEGVTAPRQIVPERTYLVSRRCSERRMFLRPSKKVNRLLLYLLAVSVERFGVLVHAYCFLSNHLHLVVTDPHGKLPQFEQYLAALIARSCNALIGRWESFWSPGSYSAVTLVEPSDVVDKIAYTLANPVAAGLVRHGSEWPGLRSPPGAIGGPPIVVRRPDHFFRPDGPMPATASFRLVLPPGFESIEEFRAAVRSQVTNREAEAARKLAAEGRSFLGVRGVLAQPRFSAPAGREPRRRLNPRIACANEARRVEALQRLRQFFQAYREAWRDFADGLRGTIFPHGTYWMRVAYGVSCASAG